MFLFQVKWMVIINYRDFLFHVCPQPCSGADVGLANWLWHAVVAHGQRDDDASF